MLLERLQVWGWWTSLALLVVIRLSWTAGDEIIPTPTDAINYAKATVHYLTGSVEDNLPPQRPGLPIVARLATILGLPYKLFLDLALVTAVAYAAIMLLSWTRSRALSISSAALMLFSPWFMIHSLIFMTEPWVSILMLVLGVSILPWFQNHPRRWRIVWVAVPTAAATLLCLMRAELMVVWFYWIFALLFVLAVHWRTLRRRLGSVGWRQLVALTMPLWIPWVVCKCVEWNHWRQYGIAAMAAGEAPGLQALLHALYSIDPEEKIRFAPVTLKSLALACDASPTLNECRQRLLDESSANFRNAHQHLGLQNQVGTWLNWHLWSAFGQPNGSTDQKMRRAADEIRLAFAESRLPSRPARFPIDPLASQWLPDCPRELLNAVQLGFFPRLDTGDVDYFLRQQHDVDLIQTSFFDDGLLRRRGNASDCRLRILGAHKGDSSEFVRVRILNQRNHVLGSGTIRNGPTSGRFELVIGPGLPLNPDGSYTIEWRHAGGRQARSTRTALQLASGWQILPVAIDGEGNARKEEWLVTLSIPGTRFNFAKSWLNNLVPVFHSGLMLLFGMGWLTGLLSRRSMGGLKRSLMLIIVVFLLLFGRCLMYALIEVWLHWGLPRYVGPHHLLFIWWGTSGAYWLGSLNRRSGAALWHWLR